MKGQRGEGIVRWGGGTTNGWGYNTTQSYNGLLRARAGAAHYILNFS